VLPLVLCCAVAAHAADPSVPFERYQLANGLTVIFSEDHRLPQVVVNVWYHVGAADQLPGRSGFAHLFEHMMFSGSKHVQPSVFTPLEAIGATGINGTTNFDRTNYFETVPSNELATALWLESDRMAFLLDTLDAKKLKVQRDVVSNERRQRYENAAGGLTFLRAMDLLFPRPHPFYEGVIGSVPEIQAATTDDLKAFFRTWYGPQNTSLALVGDFDPVQARALVEKYFGPILRGPAIVRAAIPQPAIASVITDTVQDPVAELPNLQLTYTSVKNYDPEEPAGQVLATILGGGRTSRLYKAMVFDKQVASEVSANLSTTGIGGWFTVSAQVKAGHAVTELLPLVQAELDAIKRDGPTALEVERAQRRFIAGRVRAIERLGTRADLLNGYQTFLGDPGYLAKDLARWRAVTPETVKAFAVKYLPDDHRLELTTVPAPRAGATP
jgi:predicted Zn-dependent peptidase